MYGGVANSCVRHNMSEGSCVRTRNFNLFNRQDHYITYIMRGRYEYCTINTAVQVRTSTVCSIKYLQQWNERPWKIMTGSDELFIFFCQLLLHNKTEHRSQTLSLCTPCGSGLRQTSTHARSIDCSLQGSSKEGRGRQACDGKAMKNGDRRASCSEFPSKFKNVEEKKNRSDSLYYQ